LATTKNGLFYHDNIIGDTMVADNFVVAIIIFIFGVLPGFAGTDAPRKPIGLAVWNTGTIYYDVSVLPEFDYMWSYRGNYQINAGAPTIPYFMWGTFQHYDLVCDTYIMVFHSPNARQPVGHPIMERIDGVWVNSPKLAVQKLLEVEQACPNSTLIVGQMSPHNYYSNNNGSYPGTGAEWANGFLSEYEIVTGTAFPHYLGIILSENTEADVYPIWKQLADYVTLAHQHDVRLWTSFINCKYCDYQEWRNILDLAYDNTDAVFVFANRPPKVSVEYWGSSWRCYRSLICDGHLTVAGQAVTDFIQSNGNDEKLKENK